MHIPIYLDYQSTTPLDEQVKAKMLRYLTIDGDFGNASSRAHEYGWKAREAVEAARTQVARVINAKPEEIIWTSGGTEANNLALKGAAQMYHRKGRHIITCQTEHKSVLNSVKYLANSGFEVTYLKPQSTGLIDLNKLANALRSDTVLVSIMLVNNEIGVIQDLAAIATIVKPTGAILHTDAVQAVGKIPIDVTKLNVDLLSLAIHKNYGPKGIGALYIRSNPKIHLQPQIHGGGQEFDLRSGTLATHQIVGMGEAFELGEKTMEQNNRHILNLRERLWNGLKTLDEVYVNGDPVSRIPHNLNVSFGGLKRGHDLLPEFNHLAVTNGAACYSSKVEPSYVLRALGIDYDLALSSIRFSLGKFTTVAEIDYAIDHIRSKIKS